MRTTPVALVTIAYSPELGPDKIRMLERVGVPAELQRALQASFPMTAGFHLQVVVTQFHSGHWGPTRMHLTARLVDGAGTIVRVIEADATSVMGSSRGALIQRVSQECLDQITSQL